MANGPSKLLKFEVHGKVQGVFFRKHTQETASALGLCGYVENTAAGTVRGEAHGAEAGLASLRDWLRTKGSPKSRIDRATFTLLDADSSPPAAFTIKR